MNDKLLMERKRLYDEIERFSGMPTLEYDEILKDLERKIVQIEEQLTETCDVCGGEKLMYGPANKMVYGLYDPPNGLCELTGDCDSAFSKAWRQVKIAKNIEEANRMGAKMGEQPLSSYGYMDYEMLDEYGQPMDDYQIPTHYESSQPLKEFVKETMMDDLIGYVDSMETHEQSYLGRQLEQATGMTELDSNMIALFDSVKRELVEMLRNLR